MGSWCAASEHPWRHAQKFRGILQPRHLARARCSVAATRKLPAELVATCLMNPSSGREGCPGSYVGAPVPLTYILWGSRSPRLGIPSGSRSALQQHRTGSCT